MPHAKNTRTKEKKSDNDKEPVILKPARAIDFAEEEESVPEEKADGAAAEDTDSEEAAVSDDEELDAADLNPFGDKWEE